MRWLLDQGLPRDTAGLLNAEGHDALHVGGIGMAVASDAEIMARAADLERTIATLDADFHDLLAHSGASRPSVL